MEELLDIKIQIQKGDKALQSDVIPQRLKSEVNSEADAYSRMNESDIDQILQL